MIKHFRHAPFAAWFLIVVILLGVFFLAVSLGNSNSTESVKPRVVTSLDTSESDNAHAMLTRLSQVKMISENNTADMQTWAAETSIFADSLAKHRVEITGNSKDLLATVYGTIAVVSATGQSINEDDAEAKLTYQSRIAVQYDRLAAARTGINVPGIDSMTVTEVKINQNGELMYSTSNQK